MHKGLPPTAVRRSVSLPIIIGYFFNVAYGLYFYQFLKIDVDCQFVIPKLKKFLGVFPAEQFCAANSLLWAALLFFVLNSFVVIAAVLTFNRDIRLKNDNMISLPGRSRAVLIIFIALVFCVLVYLYSDLRFSRGHSANVMNLNSDHYVWGQIVGLHVAIGLINFVFLLGFLPRFYRNISQ